MARLLLGDAVGRAMARAEAVLFKPRRWRKWAAISAAAWLAGVNEWRGLGATLEILPEGIVYFFQNPEAAARQMEKHRWELLAWMLLATVALFVIYLAFRWLSSRGQFMMLDAVVHNRIEVKESWRRHRALGNSLLRFRIGWDLAVFNLFLAVGVAAGALEWVDVRMMLHGEDFHATGWTWAALGVAAVGGIVAGIAVWLGTLFVDHFMVPVMYLRTMDARPAFRHALRKMFWPNRKAGIQYLLMMQLTEMVHATALTIGTILVILASCGIGLALLAVPLLSLLPLFPMMMIALPVDVYARAYSLYFLEQFGEEYRVNWSV